MHHTASSNQHPSYYTAYCTTHNTPATAAYAPNAAAQMHSGRTPEATRHAEASERYTREAERHSYYGRTDEATRAARYAMMHATMARRAR